MNWRAGFRRLEVVYIVVAVLNVASVSFGAGGTGVVDAVNRLRDPQEVWWATTTDYRHVEASFPPGWTAEAVRDVMIRDGLIDASNPSQPFMAEDLTFRWHAFWPTLGMLSGLWFAAWLVAKVLAWVVRGFRNESKPS